MGYGDELMNSGVAKGARDTGWRIAFGDGRKIIWHHNAFHILDGNPNVAPPGSERAPDIVWYESYPSKRPYHLGRENGRWIFNPDFRAAPGEIFFKEHELEFASRVRSIDVLIEPNVKAVAPNKQWGFARYQKVAEALRDHGLKVTQLIQNNRQPYLRNVGVIETASFRTALAILSRARVYVGPEGGLHHGAAAVDVGGVVVFGGFTHPRNTGYDIHTNIFVGDEPCGKTAPCDHCKQAMDAITVDQVVDATVAALKGRR